MYMKNLLAKITEWWRKFVKNHIIDEAPEDWDI